MKKTWMVAALMACACSAYQTPVELVRVGVLDDSCKILSADIYSESGSLDLGYTNTYLLPVRWRSNVQASSTEVNGEVIANANNTFFGSEIDYTYTLDGAALDASSQPVSVVLDAGGDANGNYVLAYPIRAENIDALRAAVPVGQTATLLVTVSVKGQLGAGGSSTTNALSFPIQLRHTTPLTCPAGEALVAGSVCANPGQDEVPTCGTP
jgi:hypothetical protein